MFLCGVFFVIAVHIVDARDAGKLAYQSIAMRAATSAPARVLERARGANFGSKAIEGASEDAVWTFGNANSRHTTVKLLRGQVSVRTPHTATRTTDIQAPLFTERSISRAVQDVLEDFAKTDDKPFFLMTRLRELGSVNWDVEVGSVNMLTHSLEAASRAVHDNVDEETVVCLLMHDIGECLDLRFHAELGAELLKPYISLANYWFMLHHELWGEYDNGLGDADDSPSSHDTRHTMQAHFAAIRDCPYYARARHLSDAYDMIAFGNYDQILSVEFFEPMVKRLLARHSSHEAI
jgi:hypothetical protein